MSPHQMLLLLPLAAAVAGAGTSGGLTMTASPGSATQSPTTFTVSWSGAPAPESTDWVAQYCADGGGRPAEPAFGAWAYVAVCPGWATGACSLQLTIADPLPQAPCASILFAMYRDPSPYTFLGQTPAIPWNTSAPTGATPRHVRLAYGADPRSEMHVSWDSDSNAAPAVLLLGLAPGAYTLPNVTAAAALSYTAEDSCGAPSAWRFPGYFHHALVTGLAPSTRYYVLPTQGGVVGKEVTFVTGKPPAPGTAVRALVYADMGISGGYGAVGTAARAAARAPGMDFALHIGDLSYGEGNVGVWEAFMDIVEPITSVVPYHVSIGNHEFDFSKSQNGAKDPSGAGQMFSPSWWNGGDDSGGECGMPTARRFRTPQTGNTVFWYSFSVGCVHVVMISSEHDPSPGSPMGDWLEGDLAAVDRTVTPWVILGMHRPIVETENYPGDYAVAAGLRAILEPLLLRYSVDVVAAGHYHSFQRSCKMAQLQCVAEGQVGIVHYTTGASGAGLDGASLVPSDYIEKTIEGKFGYSVMEANATTLTLSFFETDGDVLGDFVALVK